MLYNYLRNKQKNNDGRLITSYKISETITKTGDAHTLVETIIAPAVEAVISEVLNQGLPLIIKALPLGNDSIRWRTGEMPGHMEDMRIQRLKTMNFSNQIDESTVIDNKALLTGFV